MGPPSAVTDYSDAKDAKDLLDKIGETVHKKVHGAALEYNSQLLGHLTQAIFSDSTRVPTENPCNLDHRVHTNVTSNVIQPCKHNSGKRFSNTQGAECDYRKIRDSEKKSNCGACAPFRRLSVCDTNLEQIDPKDINTTHNLLVDVCMAAKYEGESLKNYHAQYQEKYPGSELCTVLARSFADIGDIIRGKDLFLGYNERDREKKRKLQDNLEKIFRNIQDKNRDKLSDLSLDKVREYWWERNRKEVWKALICHAPNDAQYFRFTCLNGTTRTPRKCECITHDVPTYFDYVPQYLRWFEEWAENFCRLRKHKLQNAENKCRNDEEQRYCSGNGYDCTKTVRAQEIYSMENNCPKCFFACNPFVKWLGNQKVEFLKQKEKYANEIKKTDDTKVARYGKINNLYVKDFYDELKKKHENVRSFLELLSKETACQKHPKVEGEDYFDFTKDENTTFSGTEYCKPCPICGGGFQNGVFVSKGDEEGKCPDLFSSYVPPNNVHPSKIKILISGEGHDDINKKLDDFCKKSNNNSSLYEEWNCYHENGGNDKCVLQYDEEGKSKKKVKEYIDFFKFWVTHMLNDSIEWRDKLKKCLKIKKTCKNKQCRKNCECYESWVQQKENEWKQIKRHFDTQEGFDASFRPYFVLETVLEDEYFNGISDAYADPQHMEKIRKTLDEKKEELELDASNEKTIIDFLLDHEKEDAKKCVENNPEKCEDTAVDLGRTLPGHTPGPIEHDEHDDISDDEDDGHQQQQEEEEPAEEPQQEEGSTTTEKTVPTKDVDPCQIVKELFNDPSKFSDACGLKYGKNYGWKCVTSGSTTGESATTVLGPTRRARSADSGKPTGDKGAICVPPRRRRLYVGKLHEWAKGTTEASQSSGPAGSGIGVVAAKGQTAVVSDGATSTSDQTTSQSDALLRAFIESASVETFFLWHNYKQLHKPQGGRLVPGVGVAPGIGPGGAGGPPPPELRPTLASQQQSLQQSAASFIPPGRSGFEGIQAVPFNIASSELIFGADDEASPPDPQTTLASGTIPQGFLRQMFYTLGDYRDIFDGKNIEVGDKSEDTKMKEIQKKITDILRKPRGSDQASSRNPSSSGENPKTWWNNHAEDIWKGMVCALTYKESDVKNADGTHKIEKNDGAETLLAKLKKETGKEGEYHYEKVELKDESSETQAMKTNDPASGEKTPLDSFVKRPPFFRWLEEWGESFCRQRERMLKEVRDNCTKNGGLEKKCDGEGFECTQIVKDKETNIKTFDYPSCAISCRKYKKWIKKKRTEYEKQENVYTEQREKAQKNNDGNGFCGTLKTTCNTAAEFLERLKNGPCSKINSGDGKKDKKNFDDKDKTFGHENYCDPCSEFKVKCINGVCSGTNEKCNGRRAISANDINGSTKELIMRVNDNNPNQFDGDLKIFCEGAGIFTGIKKEEWTCGKVCGLDVCGLKSYNGQNEDKKNIILISAFVKRWLENFLDDYNRIQKKLILCMNNGEESPCICVCKKNCECVEKWINLKTAEWKEIKKEYLDKYKSQDEDVYPVKTILEEGYFESDRKKAIKPCGDLTTFENSTDCSVDASSQNVKKRDVVECLLHRLQKLKDKIDKCKDEHDPKSGKPCDDTQKNCDEKSTHVGDDEHEPLEEENPVDLPEFCGDMKTQTSEEKEEIGCEPSDTSEEKKKEKEKEKEEQEDKVGGESESTGENVEKPAEAPSAPPSTPSPTEGKSEQTPVLKPKEEATEPKKPAPKKKVTPKRRPREVTHSIVTNLLLPSAFPLAVGVAFAALSYFVLKKKTKSTIDLLRVINIPKGDYGIPTLKSKNRYIPYASDRYKGKTYIYMEGDTDEDKYTFMSDTSDITSSSESEFEEIDINDIYVPGSPKYKTLIEVVLEPSKRDTMNTQSYIPLNDKLDSNKLTDEEWNQLKQDFISNILQNSQMDLPQNNISRDTSINTHPDISILHDSMEEKPFITSIHDRDLHNGEEVSYNINLDDHKNMHFSTNDDNIPSKNDQNDLYTGIDLINDSLNNDQHVDIYDEFLKRKENELFGTNHTKHTTTNIVAKQTLNDPILNQINLFHKWLDRHRNMCEEWDKNKKEELLDKLKEEWEQDYNNNSDDIHNRYENVLNTDVSIQINMNDPKPINEFTNMDTNPNNFVKDTILDDLDKHPETYFYDIYDDDITYFDIDDEKTPMGDIHIKEQTEMNALHNNKMNELLEKEYPISDIWNI
ncbi:erythrocyte membrane protein 1, PfEMP1, putative [Plasmodium sp. gorilla clade G1]|nr:erythrocyte membrane protein 1, PfEMP1, putative [Plasmodium sp. gorilla clade G1]